ncbi:MAG: glycosyltransferase family 9 protein, partial [Acidobacteria bacterium]|nr:glycosyltransferase family 9 protein [Acidobacteriota bacterium]
MAGRRILLVRLRLIGDVVFTTPLPRGLRRHFPDADITYVVEPLAEPIVRGNPHIDHILVVPRQHGFARWKDDWSWARRLRAERFDIAIDLHGGPRAAWLTWASRAPTRIGYATPGRSWMFTHTVARPDGLAPRHSVRNQWDLLTPLGIGPCDPAHDPVEMAADPEVESRVSARLRDAGIARGTPLVLIHVSAGNPFRRWPPEAFADAVVELARRDPARRFILTSGPSDADAARAIVSQTRARLGPDGSAVMTDDYDIRELRSLAARAAVYIGGDSGPLHVAATTS